MVASSVSITDERKANNEFTQGYYEIQQSLLVRKADADRYKSLTDLTGRTIGVQSGTTGEEYARSRLPPRASVRARPAGIEGLARLWGDESSLVGRARDLVAAHIALGDDPVLSRKEVEHSFA